MNLVGSPIRDFISYDAETGVLTWLRDRSPKARAGTPAGYVYVSRDGGRYIRLKFQRQHVFAHRLAWFLATGEDCSDLDHRDRDGTNNRLSNLRVATRSQQAANRRSKGSYAKGVYKTPAGTFTAHIRVNSKKQHLGTFNSEAEAATAYANRAREVFGEFASVS